MYTIIVFLHNDIPFVQKNNKIITCLLVKTHAHFVVFVQCLIYFRYFS